MCEQPSILRMRCEPVRRDGEALTMKVKVVTWCHDCEDSDETALELVMPCTLVRNRGARRAREVMGESLREELLRFGPISFQMFAHTVTDAWMRADIERMAGSRPLLINDIPMGTA